MNNPSPGIVQPTRFIMPGAQKYASFVDYIDADASTYNAHLGSFSAFADYMDNDEKTYGIFDRHGFLGADGKQAFKARVQQAETQGSPLWQQLFSFDMDWLAEYGIYDKENNQVHEELLQRYTCSAIDKMLDKEGFGSALWSASIHHNTQHLHIHIAIVDSNVSWTEGQGRCRRNAEGQLYQRGKFRSKSLEAAKSDLANNIMQTSSMTRQINDIMRQRIVSRVKSEDLIYQNAEIGEDFKQLLSSLPDDLRLWKYNMNAMQDFRPQIDALSDKIIKTYFSKDFDELIEILKKADSGYQYAYGQNRKTQRSYETSKMDELHEKLGNAILREGRNLINDGKKGYYKNHASMRYAGKNDYVERFLKSSNLGGLQKIDRAMNLINRAFYRNINSMKNQAIYQKLQNSMDK